MDHVQTLIAVFVFVEEINSESRVHDINSIPDTQMGRGWVTDPLLGWDRFGAVIMVSGCQEAVFVEAMPGDLLVISVNVVLEWVGAFCTVRFTVS